MAQHLRNIKLKDFRKFLKKTGCKLDRTSGGHEIWIRPDLKRPITIQSHVNPIPERILKQALKTLHIDRKDFWKILRK